MSAATESLWPITRGASMCQTEVFGNAVISTETHSVVRKDNFFRRRTLLPVMEDQESFRNYRIYAHRDRGNSQLLDLLERKTLIVAEALLNPGCDMATGTRLHSKRDSAKTCTFAFTSSRTLFFSFIKIKRYCIQVLPNSILSHAFVFLQLRRETQVESLIFVEHHENEFQSCLDSETLS